MEEEKSEETGWLVGWLVRKLFKDILWTTAELMKKSRGT
jgi:hypothetical protein